MYPSESAARSADQPGVNRPFRLETLVDFPDDALAAIITPARLDAMMHLLSQLGIRRVSWAYYGDGHGGYFLPAGLTQQWRNYAETLRLLTNPLRMATEAAHRHGLELYAYYKPYETGPAVSLPEGSPEARAYGRLKQQGGWLTWLDPFVVEHPDLRIRRRPDASIPDHSNVPICAIKLVKQDDSPTRVTRDHLQLWSSPLNDHYQPCQMDFTVHEAVEPCPQEVRDLDGTLVTRQHAPVRTLTLAGFRLTDPYILVTTDFSTGPGDFVNTGTDLLVALDENGNSIPGVVATGNAIWQGDQVDFRTWGLLFDIGFGRSRVCLDEPNASGRQGLIGFTRGRNEYLPGALCETEPHVRAYWLACLREMLAAGVDGVDIRVENHSTHTDYPDEYGFNTIVLEECARRNQTVAQVRGDAYTQFLREAKRLIADSGKRLRLNLNLDWFRPEPPPSRRLAYSANIHYDWQRWVEEELLDEGILRIFQLPFTTIFNDAVAAEMIARCQRKGIPLVVNRYINPDYPAEFERVRADPRFSGFILYETATFLHFQAGDHCVLDDESVAAVCRMMKA